MPNTQEKSSESSSLIAPLLIPLPQAMAMLQLSRPTMGRLVAAGKLKQVKVGRKVMFRASDIRAFVEAE